MTKSREIKIVGNEVVLIPQEIDINGKKQWRWIVEEFGGETFKNGESINVIEYSESYEHLFKPLN